MDYFGGQIMASKTSTSDGIIWVNEFQIKASLLKQIMGVDGATKAALDQHLNNVEKYTKSERRLRFGHGVKTTKMRSAYRHNSVKVSGGIATGEVFNDVEYSIYVEERIFSRKGSLKNFAPSIQEAEAELDGIVEKFLGGIVK